MKETKKEIVFEFPLLGFDKDDVDVKLTKNSLLIKAQKKHKRKIHRPNFFHFEKQKHNFFYATTLPEIDSKKTKITFTKGILKIKLPKK